MELYNYIIVGSGPSGVSAALELENAGVAIIDVGISPKSKFKQKSNAKLI
jgi:thioredoxin reductase